jgi:hypothetical protein
MNGCQDSPGCAYQMSFRFSEETGASRLATTFFFVLRYRVLSLFFSVVPRSRLPGLHYSVLQCCALVRAFVRAGAAAAAPAPVAAEAAGRNGRHSLV